MQIEFNGSEELVASIERVASFMKDPQSIAMCIPDSKDFNKIGDNSFTLQVTISIGGIGGTFDLKTLMTEQSPLGMTFDIDGKNITGSVKIYLVTNLTQKGDNTSLDWKATFELHGLISGLGEGLLKKVSQEKIGQILANLKTNVEKEA